MNIIKKINIHHLLALPFIIVPFLVTHRFQDPTLLIKRSGVFLLFAIISLLLIMFKANRNTITNSNLKCLTATVGFIILVAIISSYNSINVNESYWELLYISGWISIYTCFMLYSTKETMKYIIVSSSVVGGILSILLFNDIFNFFDLHLPSKGLMASSFGYRNYFAQYLCFAIPASTISLFIIKNNKTRILMLICFVLLIGGLILTRTRAAWLGIVIALFIFTYSNRHLIKYELKNLLKDLKGIGILLISIFSVIFFLNITDTKSFTGSWDRPSETNWPTAFKQKKSVWTTLTTIRQFATKAGWGGRVNMYKSSAGIIKDNPALGIGLGNWRLINPKYADNTSYNDSNFNKITQRPHNDFLWLLTEIGLLGMVFIIAFLIYHLRLLLRALKRMEKSEEQRYIFMFCIMGFIAIGIESMFDFPRQRTMPNLYLWSIMGFIATTSIQTASKDKYQNTVPKALAVILSVVSVFCYFDVKSNIYNQDAKYYNNNNMPNELYASSAIALSLYRNLDNAGTPIYYYMGIAKYQLGDKNTAKLLFQRALQLAPFHIGALTNYMIVLGELGELDAAYRIMQIIQHVYPNMTKASLDMAKFFIKSNVIDRAKEILLDLQNKNLGGHDRDKLILLLEETK